MKLLLMIWVSFDNNEPCIYNRNNAEEKKQEIINV